MTQRAIPKAPCGEHCGEDLVGKWGLHGGQFMIATYCRNCGYRW